MPEAQSFVAFASVHRPAKYAPLAGVGAGVGNGVGKVVGAGVGDAACASHATAQPNLAKNCTSAVWFVRLSFFVMLLTNAQSEAEAHVSSPIGQRGVCVVVFGHLTTGVHSLNLSSQ